MNRIIREARPTDMAEIMQVMDAAKGILRQFYLMGAAMQLKRMGYHMTKMS